MFVGECTIVSKAHEIFKGQKESMEKGLSAASD